MASLEKRLKELDDLKAKGVINDDEYQARRAAIVSDTGSEAEGRRRGGIFRWGLIGCLGIFAAIGIVVVLGIALLVVAVGTSDTTLEDTHVALADGSSATVETAGDVKNKLTLDAITDPAISTNEFEQPQSGSHYLTLTVTIENVGERETTGGDFKLRATDGTEYDQTFISGVGATDLNFLQNLTSGGKTTAVLVFEVKDGSEIEWLKFDPNPFAEGDLYFDKQ